MNAFGTSIPGSLATCTFMGLDRDTRYYGWILVKRITNQQIFESDAMASTSGSLKTDPYTFYNSELLIFTRNSIATRVNLLGLIEEVPINTTRLDHDPVTLAPKGMLIEEARTHLSIQLSSWTRQRVALNPSSDFPLFADGTPVFIL